MIRLADWESGANRNWLIPWCLRLVRLADWESGANRNGLVHCRACYED